MSKAYIWCQVFPGLFDSEYYVTVNGSSAYYVNKHSVRGVAEEPRPDKSVDGQVLGYVVEERDNKTLVQLSGEAVVGGLRTWVDKKQVTAA